MHRSIRGKRILLMGQHCQCLNGWVCYRDHLFFFFFSLSCGPCLRRVRLGNTTEAARECLNAYFYCGSFVARRPCYEINSVITEVE